MADRGGGMSVHGLHPGLDLPWELRGSDPGWKNRDPGWRTSPKMQQGSDFDPHAQLTTAIREGVRPDNRYFNFTLLFVYSVRVRNYYTMNDVFPCAKRVSVIQLYCVQMQLF